jgi:hypothetical protein
MLFILKRNRFHISFSNVLSTFEILDRDSRVYKLLEQIITSTFNIADGDSTFLRNFTKFLSEHTASCHSLQQYSIEAVDLFNLYETYVDIIPKTNIQMAYILIPRHH